MDDSDEPNAVLVGGPSHHRPVTLEGDIAVLEVPADGTFHRYIRTDGHRDVEGRNLVVYNYDGQMYDDPARTPDGAEHR